jgi:putative addiction module killer protein
MIEIRKTVIFAEWFDGLHDIPARTRILARIERLASGNPGDAKSVVKAFQSCGLILIPDIGFILKSKDGRC